MVALDECYGFLMSDMLIISHKKTSLLDDQVQRLYEMRFEIANNYA